MSCEVFDCSPSYFNERRDSFCLSEDMSEDLDRRTISRSSSVGTVGDLEPDAVLSDYFSSDDLDKLSSCLSEASAESKEVSNSVFYDIVQAQLALWTCVGSLLYSYAWRQHRKKFLMSIFFVVPTVFGVSLVISGLLTTIIILGRIFSAPFAYSDFLNLQDKIMPGTNETTPRKRSYSGASSVSWQSEEILPRPLCRRHSSSNGSVNGSRPPSRKLSYAFSHFAGEEQPTVEVSN